jgi:hypothetical protein
VEWDGIHLGRYKGNDLVYAGKVDHGFTPQSEKELHDGFGSDSDLDAPNARSGLPLSTDTIGAQHAISGVHVAQKKSRPKAALMFGLRNPQCWL